MFGITDAIGAGRLQRGTGTAWLSVKSLLGWHAHERGPRNEPPIIVSPLLAQALRRRLPEKWLVVKACQHSGFLRKRRRRRRRRLDRKLEAFLILLSPGGKLEEEEEEDATMIGSSFKQRCDLLVVTVNASSSNSR